MNTTKTVTITRRTRNLGFGSTSQPVRDACGGLKIDSVDRPDRVGTVAQMIRAWESAAARNSGHDWRKAFFVGGCRVVEADVLTDLQMLVTRYRGVGESASRYLADSVTLTVEVSK